MNQGGLTPLHTWLKNDYGSDIAPDHRTSLESLPSDAVTWCEATVMMAWIIYGMVAVC